MPGLSLVRCIIYGVIALSGFVFTQSLLLHYVHSPLDFLPGVGALFVATKATPASISVTGDIFLFYLAAVIFMLSEARRHRIRFVWAYIIVGYVVAACVGFPLFLIARERAKARSGVAADDLRTIDIVCVIVLAALTAGFLAWLLIA